MSQGERFRIIAIAVVTLTAIAILAALTAITQYEAKLKQKSLEDIVDVIDIISRNCWGRNCTVYCNGFVAVVNGVNLVDIAKYLIGHKHCSIIFEENDVYGVITIS